MDVVTGVLERNLHELRQQNEEEAERRLLMKDQVKSTEIAVQEILGKMDEILGDRSRIHHITSQFRRRKCDRQKSDRKKP